MSEATQVAVNGIGYPNTPGIYNQAQVEGWKQVTKAVHAQGGKIFLQLWHAGRVAHPSLLPSLDKTPVAPDILHTMDIGLNTSLGYLCWKLSRTWWNMFLFSSRCSPRY
jgi:2,4-dienoyl-CoA reductase-like NADH-dependent reductase (Old Yellow Enzyme family)